MTYAMQTTHAMIDQSSQLSTVRTSFLLIDNHLTVIIDPTNCLVSENNSLRLWAKIVWCSHATLNTWTIIVWRLHDIKHLQILQRSVRYGGLIFSQHIFFPIFISHFIKNFNTNFHVGGTRGEESSSLFL